MTPEDWQRVRSILESALELDCDQRSSYLDRECKDPSLRRELESLICAHDRAAPGVLSGVPAVALVGEDEVRIRLVAGKRVGPYEILEEIAVGGMGAVYRAIRADGQYKQQVALKIVRADLGTEFTVARFCNERQILASLDHPNIAKILDGGTTIDGLPYFVMELVDGLAITSYCDEHKLSIDARLQLFRTVCSAVHYAHQHLVIHRDLKPSNILVTAEGLPKLLDFGIAKILDPGLFPAALNVTAAGLWMMTPEYASPEQLRGEPLNTASDVYSLGLILYELLTGRRAYRFPSYMPHDVARVVLETDAEKPSAAVSLTEEPGQEASKRTLLAAGMASNLSDSRKKLRKCLAGDLDNIVLKAIRKEPGARYTSVDHLSEDIGRHLEGLPVLARKSTVAYRCRKYVLRHKVGVAAACLVLLSAMTGVALTLREARIARANELRAEKHFNDVRRLANSLLFDLHDAIQDLPGSTPARKIIVERALEYLDRLTTDASNDTGLARELATAYERVGELQGQPLASNLGDTSNALMSHQKALRIRQQIGERANAERQDRLSLAAAYRRMATDLMGLGNTHDALADIQKATAITELMSNANPNDLGVLNELGSDYDVAGTIQGNGWGPASLGELATASESFRMALAAQKRILNIDPSNLSARRAWALDAFHIGNVESDLGHTVEALDSFHNALQQFLSISNAAGDRRRAASVYNQMAMLYNRAGNPKLCLENRQKALEIYEGLVSEDPKNALFRRGLAISYVNVGDLESSLGRATAGFADINKGLRMMQRIAEADPSSDQRDFLAQVHISLADAFARAKRFSEAIQEYRTAMQIRETIHLDGLSVGVTAGIAICKVRIADAELSFGEISAAAADFQEALKLSAPHVDEKHNNDRLNTANAYAGLGDVESTRAAKLPLAGNQRQHHWLRAITWYRRSLDLAKGLPRWAPDELGGFNPADVTRHLHNAESELAKFHPH